MDPVPANDHTHTSVQVPGRGSTVLILGILSLVLCGIPGPFAWYMGKTDLHDMKAGRMDSKDQGLVQAGMICGIIGTVLLILTLIAVFVTIATTAAIGIYE